MRIKKQPFVTTDRMKSAKFGMIHTTCTFFGILFLFNYDNGSYIIDKSYWLVPLIASLMPIGYLADYFLYKRMLRNGVTRLE